MELKIKYFGDPILEKPCEDFLFTNPPHDPRDLAVSMYKFMEEKNGVGLAANQVGIPFNMFVMRSYEDKPCAIFNPRIVSISEDTNVLDEGCLSVPGFIVKVKRSAHLRIRYQDELGEVNTNVFTGMTARIIQHEMDHLKGEYYFQGLSRIVLERAIKYAHKKGYDYTGKGILKYAK